MTERSESERAATLVDRITNMPKSWVPIDGEVMNITFLPSELELVVSALRRLAAQDQKPVAWHPSDDVPNVARGASSQYILAVYRKRSGKVYSFAAEYLNAYPLRYEYGCPKGSSGFCDECSEDGCPTTGWHVVEGADDDGYTYHSLTLDDGDEVKGWREVPQWGEALSPPPAAGWDEAIEACKKIARQTEARCVRERTPGDGAAKFILQQIETLRHNAPPDSGAGESVTDLRIYCGDNPLKWAEEFCQIKQKQGWSVADIDENLMLGWFANAIEQSSDVRGCSALPDHGGADAGVPPAVLTYTNYRGETSVRSIVPKSIRYGSTEWHPEPQWLLLAHDTEKQADREFALKDFGAKPAPVAANASAEARLREALTDLQRQSNAAYCRYIDQMSKPECLGFEAKLLSGKFSKLELDAHARAGEMIGAHRALSDAVKQINEALSAHPHASDCDKQGER